MADKKDVALSGAQYRLMQILWELGEGTAADVLETWHGRRKPAHTTVGTMLSRLEKRGLLDSERRGRERVFRPLVAESRVKQSMVTQLVGTLFAGDPQGLLAHLVKDTEVTREDLEAARRLLDEELKR